MVRNMKVRSTSDLWGMLSGTIASAVGDPNNLPIWAKE